MQCVDSGIIFSMQPRKKRKENEQQLSVFCDLCITQHELLEWHINITSRGICRPSSQRRALEITNTMHSDFHL